MSEPPGSVTYGRRWNFRRHKPIDPMALEQAVARDAQGEAYMVAIGDPAGGVVPDAVIEVAWQNDHAGVWFFDEHGRQKLKYSFRRSDGRLFLRTITQWDYPDEEAPTLSGATRVDQFEFREDGTARRITSDDANRERTTEDRRGVDVSTHWEPIPRFDDWTSLARWRRDTPRS